jgi:hypothetical protein
MENLKNKDPYLHRKVEQLHQWERVLDNLIARAKKTEDKKKADVKQKKNEKMEKDKFTFGK